MAIGEICSREVVFIRRSESCADAARLMREHHVGSLVVVDEDAAGRRIPVGMLTDRDLTVGVMALGLDAENTPVEAAMPAGVVTIREDEGIGRALALMSANGVRRLPVVDASGALVGVLAADDLIELLGEEMAGLGALVARGPAHERRMRRVAVKAQAA